MGSVQAQPIVITSLRGRDGSSVSVGVPAQQGGIPLDKAREAVNVDFYRVGFARKRGGSTDLSLTCASGGPFSGHIRSCFRSASGVLYAFDATGQLFSLASGATTWNEIAVTDAVTAPSTADIRWCQGRGNRIYVAYPNAADRLHVIESGALRRAGMGTSAKPTVADGGGAGAYAATLRYYRVRWLYVSGGVTLRKGEASPASDPFTPDAAHANATVTKPTTVEDATHWQVEVSLDGSVWYVLSAAIVVATTTYADSAATTTYSTNDAASLTGQFTNWTAVGVIQSDETRLLGVSNSAIYYSPVIGTTLTNSTAFLDEEFVPDTVVQKNYINSDASGGFNLIGLIGAFLGTPWVFKANAIGRLYRTNVDTAPYQLRWLSTAGVGIARQETIVLSVDDGGQPAMYWVATGGMYRYSAVAGLQWCGADNQDLWDGGIRAALTGSASAMVTGPHGQEHAALKQVWWWVPSTSTSTAPDLVLKLDTRLHVMRNGVLRDGWSTHTGISADAACSVMHDGVFPATNPFGADLKPYVARYSTLAALRCDTTAQDDAGTAFQAYVDLPERHYAGLNHVSHVTGATMLGSTGSHSLRLTLTADYGAQPARTFDVPMAAQGTETRRRRVAEDAALADGATSFAARIGDATATASTWSIDAILLAVEPRQEARP